MLPPGSPEEHSGPPAGDAALLREAADRVEALAAGATPGRWRLGGLLATRPEVLAEGPGGSTQHVAEARARSAGWIAAVSPALAGPLAAWLRAAAADPTPEAVGVARVLVQRLP
ncbi:hypothetical protein ACI792_11535 [Blastococcus sp. SYSU DS0669]